MRKLYDFACTNDACNSHNVKTERLAEEGTLPACKACGTPMMKLISMPVVPVHVTWSKWRV